MPIQIRDAASTATSGGYVDVKGKAFGDGTAAIAFVLVDGSGNVIVSQPTTASQRTTAGGPAPGQVAKNYSGTVTLGAGVTTIPLETVTTGRTYFITDTIITSTNSAAILAQLTAATIPILQAHINATKGLEAVGIETQPTATTGQAVALVFPAGTGQIAYTVLGIEQ